MILDKPAFAQVPSAPKASYKAYIICIMYLFNVPLESRASSKREIWIPPPQKKNVALYWNIERRYNGSSVGVGSVISHSSSYTNTCHTSPAQTLSYIYDTQFILKIYYNFCHANNVLLSKIELFFGRNICDKGYKSGNVLKITVRVTIL